MANLDYFLAKRPLFYNQGTECGDIGLIKEFDNKVKVFIAIVDVLGHGQEAYKLALICRDFLEKSYNQDLIVTMKALHEHIKGSRGAVAGLCLLDIDSGILKYGGISDITARKFGTKPIRLISHDGIIGDIIKSPKEETIKLDDGDIFVLCTDGVKEHFKLEDYPGLLGDDAKTIAAHIIHEFGKVEDDATCIVVRYLQFRH